MKKKDLFDLIKTLSPNEKKIVLRDAFSYKKEGDNILLQLFRIIDRQKTYNETEVKHIPNLSNRKRELWDKIMLILLTHENGIIQILYRRKLDYAHILLKRQLFKQAEALALEVNVWSSQTEQPYIKGLALQYLSALLEHTHNTNVHEHSQRLRTELIENAESLTVAIKAYDFYMRVNRIDHSSNFIRTPELQNEASVFLQDPAMALPTEKMTLMAALMYLDAKSAIYFVLRDYKKALVIDQQAELVLSKYSSASPAHHTAYRNFLVNRLNLLDQAGEFEKCRINIAKYKQVIDVAFSNDLLSQLTYHVFNLWYYYRTNQLHPNHPLIVEAEIYYQKNYTPDLDRNFIYLQWDLIIIYFEMEQYDEAWRHCSQLVNSSIADILPDVTWFMRLFFLFILIENRQWEYLTSRIKQYEKLIKNKPLEYYRFDLVCLNFAKQMQLNGGNRKNRKEIYLNFSKAVRTLKQQGDLYTCDVLRNFDFISWSVGKAKATK